MGAKYGMIKMSKSMSALNFARETREVPLKSKFKFLEGMIAN